jgi:predicted enzyme related to lactoylglutathione lyase
MAQKVVHFEIIGKDGKKLQEFYSKLFDWKVDANNPMNYGMVSGDEAGLGGGIASAMDGGGGHVTVYVEVADLAAALKKAESLGGKTVMPPMAVPGGPEIAQFADPEGNMIGLSKAGTM